MPKTPSSKKPDKQQLLGRFAALVKAQQLQQLLRETEAAVASSPRDPQWLSWHAHALRLNGRVEDSIAPLEKVIRFDKPRAANFNALASAMKEIGQFDAALSLLDRAIKVQPNYAKAHWNRSDLVSETNGAIDQAKAALSRCPEAELHLLHFTLYRLLEKSGQPLEAFAYLSKANQGKRSQISYSAAAETAITQNIIAHFAQPQALTNASQSARPIFIVGMPRSGTTLVEQVLASHSQVHGGNELTALGESSARVQQVSRNGGEYPLWLNQCSDEQVGKIGTYYLQATDKLSRGAAYLTDKSLLNYKAVGLIAQVLPNAKIIHVLRDPMDVGFGCFRQNFASGMPFTYQIDEIASAIKDHDALTAHWQQVLPPRQYQTLDYQDFVTSPQEHISSLLDFVGLPSEPACFSPHQTRRTVRTLSATQVREPISQSSVGRWKLYQSQLQPLADLLQCN